MSLAAGARLGPYEVVCALGAGGMGEVYKAYDTRLDRVVALKVLPAEYAADPKRRARFEREARAVAALSHPHICGIFDVGRDRGIDFLVMEYLDGETLSARIARAGPHSTSGGAGLPMAEALRVATDIADALAAAHRAGVVHLDLKPGNIMLTKGAGDRSGSLQAKVLDFGLARRSGRTFVRDDSETRETDSLTATAEVAGTIPYMAPEQLDGRPVDARTDLFAFGAVVYEMIAGRRAFPASSHAAVIAAILDRDPEPLETIQPLTPEGLHRLVRKCLAKDPDARWQSAADVADELRWLSGRSAAVVHAERPNLGRLVTKLCDRQAQEEEFRDRFLEALDVHPGAPQMFFVTGDEGQCHESLVQRLVDLVDRSLAPDAHHRAGGRLKKIAWQYDGALSQRYSRQIYSLFEHFGPGGGRQPHHARDRSAAAFDALLRGTLHPYVVIQHEVHAKRWDDSSADLLAAYRRFWAELPRSTDRPVLVVFISVIFPRAAASSWRKLFPLLDASALRRRKIQRALDGFQGTAEIPCCVLAELPRVTREDVLEWFSLNHIYESEERRLRAIDRLFPGSDSAPKAMWEIESFCADVLRAFAAECRGAETR